MAHLLERNVNRWTQSQSVIVFYIFRYVVMIAMLLHALNASLTLYATFQVMYIQIKFEENAKFVGCF